LTVGGAGAAGGDRARQASGNRLLYVELDGGFEFLLLCRRRHVVAWLGVTGSQNNNRRNADRATYSTTTPCKMPVGGTGCNGCELQVVEINKQPGK
jgi:hypothetical protein